MGGNAFSDVGAIHKSEVAPTLVLLEEKLKLPMTLLGSTGKKEFSGDIDIAVEMAPEDMHKFFNKLKGIYGDHDVRKYGSIYSTHVPIANYNANLETDRKRTGMVQVDFIFGSIPFLQLFYHSPVSSRLKGTHRNIAISTLAGFTDREEDTYCDGFDRPIWLRRWKWSPTTALTRVERTSRRNDKTKKWIKKQDEVHLCKSITDPATIARILFKGELGIEYLDSCEKVIEAINIVYKDEPDYRERIFKQMAWDLQNNHNIGNVGWDYPEDVLKYME